MLFSSSKSSLVVASSFAFLGSKQHRYLITSHPRILRRLLSTLSALDCPFRFVSQPSREAVVVNPQVISVFLSISNQLPSHLATLHNADIIHWAIPLCGIRPDLLDLPHDLLALNDASKDDMLSIQERRWGTRNEELTPVCIRARVGHGEQEGRVVLVCEILVRKALGVLERVDGGRAGAVGVQEVAALDHEGFDDAVEFGVLVALQRRGRCGAIANAELAEVFGGEWHGARVEKHFDPTERFA
jgi:hypothetical protein